MARLRSGCALRHRRRGLHLHILRSVEHRRDRGRPNHPWHDAQVVLRPVHPSGRRCEQRRVRRPHNIHPRGGFGLSPEGGQGRALHGRGTRHQHHAQACDGGREQRGPAGLHHRIPWRRQPRRLRRRGNRCPLPLLGRRGRAREVLHLPWRQERLQGRPVRRGAGR